MMLSLYFGTLETIYVISRQLGYEHKHSPSFSSQLLFEVTKDSEKGFMVSATYNKREIAFKGACNGETLCNMTNFFSFIKEISADESELSGCSPVENKLMLTSMNNIPSTDSTMLNFIVFFAIFGCLSLLIGGILGHKAAQKENRKRRIAVNMFDQESLIES